MRIVTAGLLVAALALAACAESPTSSAPDFAGAPATSEPASGGASGSAPPETATSPPAPSTPPAAACAPQTAEVREDPDAATFEGEPPVELQVEVLEPADEGAPTPEPGDCVQVHYVGRLFGTGEVFDSSHPRGSTLPLTIGAGVVIPGFEQGVTSTPLGATTRVTIPPELGYGAQGAGPIPPDATLVFDIEVVDIQ